MLSAVALLLGGMLFSLSVTRPGSGTFAPALCVLAGAVAAAIHAIIQLFRDPSEAEIGSASLRWTVNNQQHEILWSNVEEFRRMELLVNGIPRRSFKVTANDGREVTLTPALGNYDALVHAAEALSFDPVLEKKRIELQRGFANFGPVTIQNNGISLRANLLEKDPVERFVRWEQIKAVEVQRGALCVFPYAAPHPRCSFLPVSLSSIPNYRVLLQIVNEQRMQRINRHSA